MPSKWKSWNHVHIELGSNKKKSYKNLMFYNKCLTCSTKLNCHKT